MSKPSLCVISPVYNEEEIIGNFYRELKRVLSELETEFETSILLVVDRCTDNTESVLKLLASQDPSLKLLFLSSRFGQQNSLLAGIDYVDADAVVMMDSDLQHPPSILPELVKKFQQGNDVVYTVKKDNSRIPVFNRFTSYLFYKLLYSISDSHIIRHGADFRLMSRRVVDAFKYDIRERSLFLRGLISWVGFKQDCVEFSVASRTAGTSKYSVSKLITFALTGITSFSSKPLRIMTYVGLLSSLFGVCILIFVLVSYFFYDVPVKGWASIASMIAFFSGIQLFFMGIIGEYIGGIFFEVKQRPHYLLSEAINIQRPQPRQWREY